MENMEMTNLNVTETVEEIAEAIPADKNHFATVVGFGIISAGAIGAWELAVKPIYRMAKKKLVKWKENHKTKTEKEPEDLSDMNLDDIPEIEN